MATYALISFAIAAIGGLILASRVLTGKLAPWSVSLLHGLAGAAGLAMLFVAATNTSGATQLTAALGLLFIAALGGFYLMSYHVRERVPPKFVVIVHAAIAVLGVAILGTVVMGIQQ